MFSLYLILPTIQAAGLDASAGEMVGYSYIALTVSLALLYVFLIYKNPHAKGLKATIIQLIVFSQFSRYSTLINFNHSEFYLKTFRTYIKTSDPIELFKCSKSGTPWSTLGFNSTNFLCNSWALLTLTGILMLVYIISLLFTKKPSIYSGLLTLITYCSVTDLSFSSFLQLKYISFIGTINTIGSITAIIYLTAVLTFLALEIFYLYKNKRINWLLLLVTDEFQQEKDYQFYLYYPILMFKILLHMCLLVFSRDKPYTVPIVISIVNLIHCNLHLVSYIVSMRPYIYTSTMVFAVSIQIIEIIFLYIPLLYNYTTLPFSFIDILSIFLFVLGNSFISTRFYFLYKAKISSPVQSQVFSNSNLQFNEEVQDSSVLNLENDINDKNFSGFLQTFKPPLPKNKKNLNKIQPESTSNNRDSTNGSKLKNKGSYFLKPFKRAPVNPNTDNLFRLPESVSEEGLIGTARFVNSSRNSENRIHKMPDNTPVDSKKLIINNFSELENMSDDHQRIRNVNSYEETPSSNISSGKGLKSRFNINEFTVRCKIDEKEQEY